MIRTEDGSLKWWRVEYEIFPTRAIHLEDVEADNSVSAEAGILSQHPDVDVRIRRVYPRPD